MGAQVRQLRRRIRSVQSTKKITKAMELIAASRIVRAERRVREARPFSEKITEVIKDLAATAGNVEHPLLERHEGAPDGLVVVSADRGLCGAYNANVLRTYERTRREVGPERVTTYSIGRKAASAFRFRNIDCADQWQGFSDNPAIEDAARVASRVIDDFNLGRIGSATLVYTEFASLFTQRPVTFQVLPVQPEVLEGGEGFSAVHEFEPEPEAILGHLLPLYVESKIFHALLESAASEHAARRRAMSSATDNADEMIRTLTREVNRARQQEITMEIADIIGGAEALRESKAEVGS